MQQIYEQNAIEENNNNMHNNNNNNFKVLKCVVLKLVIKVEDDFICLVSSTKPNQLIWFSSYSVFQSLSNSVVSIFPEIPNGLLHDQWCEKETARVKLIILICLTSNGWLSDTIESWVRGIEILDMGLSESGKAIHKNIITD